MATTKRNIKMTNQRRVILDELHASMIHPTADELYDLVRKTLPKISLATVYRNLEALSAAGLVRKIKVAGGQMRFDRTVDDHLHVTCTECGKIDDIAQKSSAGLIKKYNSVTDFEISGCSIEFTGLCPDCMKGKRRK